MNAQLPREEPIMRWIAEPSGEMPTFRLDDQAS